MPRFVNSWLSRANQKAVARLLNRSRRLQARSLKQWTQLDDLTHDFMQNERFRESCLEKYGQYVTFDGVRVTR